MKLHEDKLVDILLKIILVIGIIIISIVVGGLYSLFAMIHPLLVGLLLAYIVISLITVAYAYVKDIDLIDEVDKLFNAIKIWLSENIFKKLKK